MDNTDEPPLPRWLAVIDTETTGMDLDDEPIELAVVTVKLRPWQWVDRWSSLLRPSVPVKPEARAAHHVRDGDLAMAPTAGSLFDGGLLPGMDGPDVIPVAHNAPFDLMMLARVGICLGDRYLCTWKLAQHLWPDAPSYKNQVLRYWLGILVETEKYGPTHRALPDAVVTACIVREMLRLRTLPELLTLMDVPVLQKTCKIGKEWSGRPWSEVDEGMLRWILDPARSFDEDVLYAARYWLNERTGRKS